MTTHSPATREYRRLLATDSLKFLALLGVVAWLLARGTAELGYRWQWYRTPDFFWDDGPGLLLQGLWVTIQVTAVSFVLAFTFGLTTALLRLSHSIVGNAVARFYLESIRNTPLLIQLFFMYFALSPILGINGYWSAVLALSLFEGAYASEIFRAGITSIEKGQWEAAYSLGGDKWFAYQNVILPQAVRRIIPPLIGQGVSLIKDSALVSTIAVYDLTMRGDALVSETFMVFEVWFLVAAIYLVLTLSLSGAITMVEAKTRGMWTT